MPWGEVTFQPLEQAPGVLMRIGNSVLRESIVLREVAGNFASATTLDELLRNVVVELHNVQLRFHCLRCRGSKTVPLHLENLMEAIFMAWEILARGSEDCGRMVWWLRVVMVHLHLVLFLSVTISVEFNFRLAADERS